MKKLFTNRFVAVAFIAIILGALTAPAVLADTAQLNAAGDYPVLQVSNYTKYPGSNANWSTTVSANPGESLSFMVFYHNTSPVTAFNTRVKLNLPATISNGTAVTATVSADNTTSVSSTVYVYLVNGGSVAASGIVGSASWYQNNSPVNIGWPYGETGDEIINSAIGVNLGNILPSSSGYVIVRVQLGGATYPYAYQNTYQTNYTTSPYSTNIVSNNSGTITLSGVVTPNNSMTTAWFEYGPTTSFGYITPSQTLSASSYSSNYSYTLANLPPNTTYYYRAVASNSGGISYGSVYTFSTGGAAYVATSPSTVNVSGLSSALSSMQTLLAEMKSQYSQPGTQNNVASAKTPGTTGNEFGANILSAFGGGTLLLVLSVLAIMGIGAFLLIKFVLK